MSASFFGLRNASSDVILNKSKHLSKRRSVKIHSLHMQLLIEQLHEEKTCESSLDVISMYCSLYLLYFTASSNLIPIAVYRSLSEER